MTHVRSIAAWLPALCLALAGSGAAAQDGEQIPTAKLDRIPAQPAFAGQTRAPAAPRSQFDVEVLRADLRAPWALAFLPGGDILVNEYVGEMRIVGRDGSLSEPLGGLPVISTDGWAGLFDVALHPDFDDNRLVYFSYTAPGAGEGAPNIARVARGRLDRAGNRLRDVEVIVDGFGGQELFFAPDGMLLVAGAANGMEGGPQDLASTQGKLLRLTPDGGVPDDNPWTGRAGVNEAILTRGHRDISGITARPGSGEIWITEHGPRGGDELNLIVPGANYGWDVISYGTNYDGTPVGNGASAGEGMEQPRYFWRPSIAPSGLAFYTGDAFPAWRGNLFVTALSGQHVVRLVMDGDRVVAEERLLVERAKRVRELKEGPDGALYVLTNEESDAPQGSGELLRIAPVATGRAN